MTASPASPPVLALVVAAGRGQRLAGDVPKQYRYLGSRPLLRYSVESLLNHERISGVAVVIHPDDVALYELATEGLGLLPPIMGGARRQDSVLAGLTALAEEAGGQNAMVLIHDAARPFLDPAVIDRLLAALEQNKAALPVLAVADTLKLGKDGAVTGTVSRDNLYRAQTPQAFHLAPLIAAHEAHGAENVTDDAALMELAGHRVQLVEGTERVFKVTTAQDLERAQRMVAMAREVRIGNGFDVHRFDEGDHVTLCGISVPHHQGLSGHSDADVGLHAIVDAMLGALSEGDIGQHFPPSDPQWKGAPSRLFLEQANRVMTARGGRILNIDLTLICEAPKIGPHREVMRKSIADILGISLSRVSVKATTTEKLGFTGRKEGIAGQATVSIEVPGEMP